MGRNGMGTCHTLAPGVHQMAGTPSFAGQEACLTYLRVISSSPQGVSHILSCSEVPSEIYIPF
jgi:hypothetical protein